MIIYFLIGAVLWFFAIFCDDEKARQNDDDYWSDALSFLGVYIVFWPFVILVKIFTMKP